MDPKSVPDGGPAFSEVPADCNGYEGRPGMTLRDYFAAKAMQAVLRNNQGLNIGSVELAHLAYEVADAMLQVRAA